MIILNFNNKGQKLVPLPTWIKIILNIKDKRKNDPKLTSKNNNNNNGLLSTTSSTCPFRPSFTFNSDFNICNNNTNNDSNQMLYNKKKTCLYFKRLEKQVKSLYKLLDLNFNKYQEEKLNQENKQSILDEWKDAATRLENFFLYISSFIIILFPFVLFGRFYFKDYTINTFKTNNCGCNYS